MRHGLRSRFFFYIKIIGDPGPLPKNIIGIEFCRWFLQFIRKIYNWLRPCSLQVITKYSHEIRKFVQTAEIMPLWR